MITRRLGSTNWQVSIVGFGGIPIQQCDQDQVRDLLKLAIDRGVNFIDTARGYTVSEALIGHALKSLDRDSLYIATKTMGRTYEDAKKDFEISFRDLSLDTIDLYQFHNVSKEEDYQTIMGPGGAMEFFLEMKEKGYIREIGITSHSADLLREKIEDKKFQENISTIQFPNSAVETQGLDIFKRARELDMGTIAMKPIAGGVLLNHAEESLRLILENEDLTLAIPGMYTEEEVIKNTDLAINYKPLDDDERKSLKEEADLLGNDFCRRCNYCQPCPQNINISGLFLLELYYEKYGLVDWASKRYEDTPVKADECIKCGKCEAKCPYHLQIRDRLDHIDQLFNGGI